MNQQDENLCRSYAYGEIPRTQIADISTVRTNTETPVEESETAVTKVADTDDAGHHEVHKPMEIGGWLLFFCYTTTLDASLMLLMATICIVSAVNLCSLFTMALAAFQLFVGISVWRGSRHIFGYLRVYFILMLCVGIQDIVVGFIQHQLHEMSRANFSFLVGRKVIISSLFWWAYFARSQRVAATFGRNI